MTLIAFNLAIDRFIKEDVPEAANTIVRVLSAQALRGVVLRSPVKTGRFRGGWEVSVQERSYDRNRAPDPDGAATIAEGLGRLERLPPFATVFLQNNVEYGPDLEGGSSKQAPAGVLAVTVADIEASAA